MSLVDLTALLGAAVTFLGVVTIPLYLNRRTEKRITARDAAREQEALEAGTEVSWEAINKAIVIERDTVKRDLATQAASHTAEIATMRAAHAQEIAELKRDHAAEMTSWSRRLAECQAQVQKLYGELYELQKLLPPRAQ